MKDILHPKDEREPLVLKGEWWSPADTTKTLSGTMNFEIGGDSDLELLGAFDPKNGHSIDVVRGRCIPTLHATLLRCVSIGGSRNFGHGLYSEVSKFRFIDAWIGEMGFNSEAEIMFDSYSFGITNLDAWHFSECFTTDEYKFGEPIVIRYTPPDPVTLFVDDIVRIELIYQYRGPTQELVQNSSTIEHVPRIVIRSLHGRLPYYGDEKSFRYYEYRIASLFGALIGVSAAVYGRCGHVHQTIEDCDGKVLPTSCTVRYFNRRDFPVKLLQRQFFDKIFIPYPLIKDSVQSISSKFFALNKDVIQLVDRLAYIRSTRAAIPYAGVPELVFMFEGLARNLYARDVVVWPSQMPGYAQHESRRQQVKQMLASEIELSNWTFKKLKLSPPILKRLFETARQKVKDACLYCDDVEGFGQYVEYLRMKRDGFAHSETKNAGHEKMDVPAYYWLHAFMIIMVLVECGVDSKLIRNRLPCCSDFRWAMDTFKDEFYNGTMSVPKEEV